MRVPATTVYISLGVLAGGALLYGVISAMVSRVKDKAAGVFLEELMRCLNPSGAGIQQNNAFDPNYWQTARQQSNGRAVLLTLSQARQLAQQIANARGWLWGLGDDDEKQIYEVYSTVQDKAQASQVALAFQQLPGKGRLSDELHDWLSEAEIYHLLTLVNRLPDYRITS